MVYVNIKIKKFIFRNNQKFYHLQILWKMRKLKNYDSNSIFFLMDGNYLVMSVKQLGRRDIALNAE